MSLLAKIRLLLRLPGELLELLVRHWPGDTGQLFRVLYWRGRLKHLGENVKIGPGVSIRRPEYVSIDDGAWLDQGVVILAGPPAGTRATHERKNPDYAGETGEVRIGAHSHVAPYCVLSGMGGLAVGTHTLVAAHGAVYSFSHHYRNLNDREDATQYSSSSRARPDQQAMILSPVVIGDYCCVGLGSVVLPGSTLERGSWLASGSVATGRYGPQVVFRHEVETALKDISDLAILE